MDEDNLESHSNDLNDTIGNMDTARDGIILSEDTNSYSESAVDIDEENSKVKQEEINLIVCAQ